MAIFGVKIEDVATARKFIRETNARLNEHNLARNPFTAYLKQFKQDGDLIAVFKMVPLWPNFPPYVAGISFISILLFGGHTNTGLLLIPLVFLGLGFFWTEDFFYLTFKLGLRKVGYKGPVKKFKRKDLIDELARRV